MPGRRRTGAEPMRCGAISRKRASSTKPSLFSPPSSDDHPSSTEMAAEAIKDRVDDGFEARLPLKSALQKAQAALAGPERTLVAGDLEVAILARGTGRRSFRRIVDEELAGLVS